MRKTALILAALAAFTLGGWLASRRPALSGASRVSVPMAGAHELAPGTKSHLLNPGSVSPTEERFTRLLGIAQNWTGLLKSRAEAADILDEVGADEIAVLVERIAKLPSLYCYRLLSAALDRWLDLDPAAAQRWVQATPANRANGWQIWAARDPDGAIAFALRDGRLNSINQISLDAALSALDGEDYVARCRRLAALPATQLRDSVLRQHVSQLIRRDARGALAFLATLPPGELRDSLLPQIIAEAAEADPRGALAFLDRQPDSPRKQEALEPVLVAMAAREPAESLARVEAMLPSLRTGIVGSLFINRFMNALAQKDLAAARTWVESLPAGLGQDPLIAVGREWAKTEPVAALGWTIAHGADVMRSLHESEPVAALELASADYGADVTRGLHEFGWSGAVLKEAMLNHPEETVQWVKAFPPGEERDRLIERAFHERLDNLRPEQLFNDSNEILFDLLAELPPDAQPRAARDLGTKRAGRASFTDLDAWAAKFPVGPAQDAAISGALQRLADSNSARAETIIEAITDQHQRDAAVSGLASGMARRDPAGAAARAQEIRDPAIRFDTLDRVIPQWLRAFPAAARTWLAAANTIPRDWRMAWEAEAAQ